MKNKLNLSVGREQIRKSKYVVINRGKLIRAAIRVLKMPNVPLIYLFFPFRSDTCDYKNTSKYNVDTAYMYCNNFIPCFKNGICDSKATL